MGPLQWSQKGSNDQQDTVPPFLEHCYQCKRIQRDTEYRGQPSQAIGMHIQPDTPCNWTVMWRVLSSGMCQQGTGTDENFPTGNNARGDKHLPFLED
jgi:hypothetical protein